MDKKMDPERQRKDLMVEIEKFRLWERILEGYDFIVNKVAEEL